MEEINLKLDYFGTYDPRGPGSMAYNWRKVFWYGAEGVAYGVHGNSGYLFRFDPHRKEIELVERITSSPSRRSRSEEHTSELQSIMRISYAVFCLKKKKHNHIHKRTLILHPTT